MTASRMKRRNFILASLSALAFAAPAVALAERKKQKRHRPADIALAFASVSAWMRLEAARVLASGTTEEMAAHTIRNLVLYRLYAEDLKAQRSERFSDEIAKSLKVQVKRFTFAPVVSVSLASDYGASDVVYVDGRVTTERWSMRLPRPSGDLVTAEAS